MGLNGNAIHNEDTPRGTFLGERGVLYVMPYLNPWNWMNAAAVRETDEIVRAALARVGVPEGSVPVISTGGSMGGLCALVWPVYSALHPSAVVANCPVCDLVYHYGERSDLPRTLYAAFADAEGDTVGEALAARSPLHLAQAGRMPRIDITIFHCEEDKAVNKQKHSDRLVEALRPMPVAYYAVPGRGHCDLTDEMAALYNQTICRCAGVK